MYTLHLGSLILLLLFFLVSFSFPHNLFLSAAIDAFILLGRHSVHRIMQKWVL